MKKHHKSYNYTFTEKSHSKRGILALVLAVLSLVLGIAMVVISFVHNGSGNVYLGSSGMLGLLLAATAFTLAVLSMREDKSYKLYPMAGLIAGLIALAGWLAVYMVGLLSV